MPDDKVTYTEAAATAKSRRRLPEESLRRARNILLNLDFPACYGVFEGDEESTRFEIDVRMMQRYLLSWAERLEDLRPKPEEGGAHGKD